ncbi:MAG TPA: FHA domain-containing protein [Anaerolineaceae bacterium]
MAASELLELIRLDGTVEFIPLNQSKGVVQIGRDSTCDLVLDSPQIAGVHAILDYHQKPYQLVLMGERGDARLNGQAIQPRLRYELHPGQTLEIEGSILFLVPAEGALETVAPVQTETSLAVPGGLSLLPARPPDQMDEMIVSDMGERQATVNVDQTATWTVNVANGGSLVAAFEIHVEGINPSWVTILPPRLNLNEGGKASATIAITPPRHPSSRAGSHHFAIVITSANYPGRRSLRGATLVINPYQEFTVSELSPRQHSVTWFKRTVLSQLQVANLSNSEGVFRLEGMDDEKALDFEFKIPSERASLATRAQFTLDPEQALTVPVRITCRRRTFIALTHHQHSFTVNTSLVDSPQPARMLLGYVRRLPLIGPLLIFLLLLLGAALTIFTFYPRITFTALPSTIVAGQATRLEWSAFPPFMVTVTLNDEPVPAPRGSQNLRLIKTTTYKIKANTWLSTIFPTLAATQTHTINVTPVRPEILLFEANPEQINAANQGVIISWLVLNADEVSLVNTTAGKEDKLDKPYGARTVNLEKGSVYVLNVKNNSMPDQPVQKQLTIPLIIPVPVIESFSLSTETINAGQSVTVKWKVRNAAKVSLEPGAAELPASGELVVTPKETGAIVLTAVNGPETVRAMKQVTVRPPPAAAAPPVIDAFVASPEKGVGSASGKLTWSISGPYGKIELTDGSTIWNNVKGTTEYDEAIKAKGSKGFSVTETTLYTLTVYNGDQKVVKTATVTIDPPPDPAPPVIENFSLSPEAPVTYPVTVTLNWMINDPWTKFELSYDDRVFSTDKSSPNYDSTLKAQGSKSIAAVNKPTMFVLTVWNGSTKVVKSVTMK